MVGEVTYFATSITTILTSYEMLLFQQTYLAGVIYPLYLWFEGEVIDSAMNMHVIDTIDEVSM